MLSSFQTQLSDLRQKYLTIHVLAPLLILGAIVYFLLPDWEVSQPPGILAPQAPRLAALSGEQPISLGNYTLTPLAAYDVNARVLARRHYYWGREANLAPVDLLLGWREMSDTATLKSFSFHLSNRWYTWSARELPFSEDEIDQDLDNNHLIPSDDVIKAKLEHVRPGQIIHIAGMLVKIDGKDGYNWISSLNIGSTGGPLSCKLIYVLKVDVVK